MPIRLPTRAAVRAALKVSGFSSSSGLIRKSAKEKPSRLTPRLAQNAPWSSAPRVLGVPRRG
ncbi:hypothetical protein ACFQX6_41780 [Streptosporangium lutulentum]